MTTKYGIFNPLDGQYVFSDNQDGALDAASQIALDFYLNHTHQSPIAFIEVLEDGSEVWTNSAGNTFPSPLDIKTRLAKVGGILPVTKV